ncbi:MAG: TIGR04084 family radical SAM/SPASM domain-containing protein [Candidatus Thermoplasmatota archaeon]|nr:TIGR04084 family radical SAM/SPASM domain-containing protein [Candidatus Thermoplasmatota archaeon]
MLYIIITTPLCNLHCSYCGGSLHGMPTDISYNEDQLQSLIRRDSEAIVAFYGGEPLLRPKTVKHYLDILPAKHFVINTNGYFIKSIANELEQFDTILLSIDGRKQVTDMYREEGCYDQVFTARDMIKDSSFHGELIARMAVSKYTDIYKDVSHLLQYFPFVHWQLDVVWSALWELPDFHRWAETNYKPGLRKLIDEWISQINKGKITVIIPFRGIMTRLLYDITGLPCRSGQNAISITTDGKILACPIAPDYDWNRLGSLSEGFKRISVEEPCLSCDAYSVCGGRCLFANQERLWGKEGFNAICGVTKFLINELKEYKDVCKLYKEKIKYPPFNNTTEIIP